MNIFNMILQGSLMILCLCLLRPLLLRWSTPRARSLLWLIPALRLLLPLPSLPARQTAAPAAVVLHLQLARAYTAIQSPEAARPFPWLWLWLAGSAAALIWLCLSNLRFARQTRPQGMYQNLPLRSGPAACLFGLFRPAIVLPDGLDETTRAMALRHEYCHFLRRDHLRHGLFALLLCLYWWNPLLWLAAHLHRQDCESACDRRTVSHMTPQQQKDYLRALLTLADRPHSPRPALGGTARHMKRRILNMKNLPLSPWKTGCALALALLLTLSTAAVALGEDVATIGGADGPTSITISESSDASIGIIGGADGPTSIWVSAAEDADSFTAILSAIGDADGPASLILTNPQTGDALSLSGELLGLAHYLSGECQAMICAPQEADAAQMDALLTQAAQQTLAPAPEDLPSEFLLLFIRHADNELTTAYVFEQDGQTILRLQNADMPLPDGTYAELLSLLSALSAQGE